VPPITIRPDASKGGSGRSMSSSLTTILQNIIRDNDKFGAIIPDEIDAKYEKMIYDFNELHYAYVRGSTAKGGTDLPTTIAQRLKGKQGRYRKNMEGKRVSWVARTTITGSSQLQINQLGVPQRFCKNLQIKEYVQEFNRKRLMVNFLNGVEKYPGCTKIIKRQTGAVIKITAATSADVELEIGDCIYRDLQTGDYILFNRQPSLLPSSISAMEVVVINDGSILTFLMNVIVTRLFNADFDGDQMNVYLLKGIAARNEIKQLSSVPRWFIKHASGAPMMGQHDDSIIGSYCLTRDHVKVDKYHAMQIFSHSTYVPQFLQKEYSGYDLISLVLGETPINFSKVPALYNDKFNGLLEYNPKEISVSIVDGKHISGVLDKKSIGSGSVGSLYHVLYLEYGPDRALEVMYNMQQMAINYLFQRGFSIGIMDLLIGKEALTEIYEIESSIIAKAQLITNQLIRAEIISPVGKTTREYYEEMQIAALKIVDDFSGVIFKSVDHAANNLIQLILSGSKGSINHFFHISSAIGQINIVGKRPPEKFVGRCLPHFKRFDMDPAAHGFIRNSYISGMSAYEVFFGSQNARYDFISKALTTSVTGDKERQSMKNLESITINNNGCCVKGNTIIQIIYGADGLDPCRLARVTCPTLLISDDALRAGWHSEGDAAFEEEFGAIVADRIRYRNIFECVERTTDYGYGSAVPVVLDVGKFTKAAIAKYATSSKDTQIDKKELVAHVKRVKEFCESLPYIFTNEMMEAKHAPIPHQFEKAVWFTCMVVRAELNSKRTLHMMSSKVLEIVLAKIRSRLTSAVVDYGLAVGVIAAMSFSEPLTQYMLNSLHRSTSGGTSKSVLTDVKEIFGAKPTAKLSGPSMTIVMKDESHGINWNSEAKAQQVANFIEALTIGDFAQIAQIFYEKFAEPVHPLYVREAAMIAEFLKYNPLIKPPGDLTKWCIRFVLDKTKMIYKNMTIEYIVGKLRLMFKEVYIVHSAENVNEVVLRIYIRSGMFKGQITMEMVAGFRDELMRTIIRGIQGVSAASVAKVKRSVVKPDGSVGVVEKYAVTTTGTNLYEAARCSAVDVYDMTSSAVEEIQEWLGIEAALSKLTNSIRNIGEGGLDYHHAFIFSDEMTFTGRVTSIEKQGLKARETDNVLLRMGYSAPIQVLEEAALNSIVDEITGITGPLLVGYIPRDIGTARNEFHINEAIVRANTVRPDDWLNQL
jgi:DNA-directed RNA polymerase beta' subunit